MHFFFPPERGLDSRVILASLRQTYLQVLWWTVMNSSEDIGTLCWFYRISDSESLPLYWMIVKLACVFYSSDINFLAAHFHLFFGRLFEQFVLSCIIGLWLILRIVAGFLQRALVGHELQSFSIFTLRSFGLNPGLSFLHLARAGASMFARML